VRKITALQIQLAGLKEQQVI